MKKILFLVTKGDNIGGAQIYAKELAIKFHQDNYGITVVSGNEGAFTNQIESENIPIIIAKHLKVSIHPLHDVLALFQLINIIRKEKPDLVCINSSKSGILGRLACWITKTKNVFVVHGWSFTDGISKIKIFIFKLIEKSLKRISNYWVCVSDFDYQLGLKSKVINPKNTLVIKNGIKDKKIEKSSEKNNSQTTTLIFIARHDHQKDHKTVFNAIKEIDNIHVLLIGDGPLFEKNKKLALNLGIENKLSFLGYQKNVEQFLSKADIFILVSNWEGFPLSTLEAMSAGLPIIVTNVGGAAEAIKNNVEGFVISKGDIEALNNKIKLLQRDLPLRLQMGNAARESYLNNFTFEKN